MSDNTELQQQVAVLTKQVENLKYERDILLQRYRRAEYKLSRKPCSCQVPQGPLAWPT